MSNSWIHSIAETGSWEADFKSSWNYWTSFLVQRTPKSIVTCPSCLWFKCAIDQPAFYSFCLGSNIQTWFKFDMPVHHDVQMIMLAWGISPWSSMWILFQNAQHFESTNIWGLPTLMLILHLNRLRMNFHIQFSEWICCSMRMGNLRSLSKIWVSGYLVMDIMYCNFAVMIIQFVTLLMSSQST